MIVCVYTRVDVDVQFCARHFYPMPVCFDVCQYVFVHVCRRYCVFQYGRVCMYVLLTPLCHRYLYLQHTYIHTYIHTHIHTYAYIYTHFCMIVLFYVVDVCIHNIHAHTYIYKQTNKHTYIHT